MKSWIVSAPENPYFRWIFDFIVATGQWRREVHMMGIDGVLETRGVVEGETARASALFCGLVET